MRQAVLESNSVKAYISLFHEGVIANLLESCLYHKTACDGADNAL